MKKKIPVVIRINITESSIDNTLSFQALTHCDNPPRSTNSNITPFK